jgi:hypothetical protein
MKQFFKIIFVIIVIFAACYLIFELGLKIDAAHTSNCFYSNSNIKSIAAENKDIICEATQCTSFTKKHKRCKNKTKNCNGICSIHFTPNS